MDEVNIAVDDVEQQNTADMTVSGYFSSSAQQETSPPMTAATTTSLTDMLK